MEEINALDFLHDWNFSREQVGNDFLSRWKEKRFQFTKLNQQETEEAYLRVLHLFDGDVKKSGQHRIIEWEKGWGENFSAFKISGDIEDLRPKYFNKISTMQIRGEWVNPLTKDLELQLLWELIDAVSSSYFKGLKQILEFGCGTGHNLLRLREIFPSIELVGLDWTRASQDIIHEVASYLEDKSLRAMNFDFYNPDSSVRPAPNSGAITVAALEQIGNSHSAFIDFILGSNVEIVVNIEPIGEVLSDEILLESISKRYFKKRNYLSGYLDKLQELHGQGKIELLQVNRAFFGSFFIEGYTTIVWRPVR